MKIILVAVWISLAIGFAASPSNATARSSNCASDGSLNSCNGPSRVTVRGHGGTLGSDGSSDVRTSIGGPVTRKWVTCGRGAVVQLRALGDRSPAADSGSPCAAAAVAGCRRQGITDGLLHAQGVIVVRQRDGSWAYAGGRCAATGPPRVTAQLVRDRIARLVPGAAVGVAPDGDTLVNIETVLWVDAPGQQVLAPLTILGQRVAVTLTLARVDWSFGDGTQQATSSAGRRYDTASDPCRTAQCPGYYGHTYTATGPMGVSATVAWTARFRVDGRASVTIPGTVVGPAGRADVTVRQARGILVPDPGR